MRTIAYIDGYNLYYGRLKDTAYKWLDVHRLVAEILAVQDPASQLLETHYFTAPIKARIATHGAKAAESQQTYVRALSSRGVVIHQGRLELESYLAITYKKPPDKSDRTRIWRLEEKETDVRLALTLYRDALRQRCDQIVLCTNDSDLTPALESVRRDFPAIRIGVILPARDGIRARQSGSLRSLATWTRTKILDEELARCQLPNRVPTRRAPAVKPDYW